MTLIKLGGRSLNWFVNPKLSQLSNELSYDNFSFNGIMNLALSVVEPDMHLNLISKSTSP